MKPVTIALDDIDVRKALDLLAREGNINILVAPSVAGRITVNLRGLTLDQALHAVLKTANLVARSENGVLYVTTAEEVERLTDEKLPVRVYRLNYIRSVDLEKMIKPFLSTRGKMTSSPASQVGIPSVSRVGGSNGTSPGGATGSSSGGAGGSGATSPTGGDSLASGEVVLIQDREPVLAMLDRIIVQLDVQPAQVLIEAVLLTLELNKNQEFGVNFAVVDSAGKVLSVVGNGALLNAAAGFDPSRVITAEGLLKGSPRGFGADEHGARFGVSSRNVTAFLRAIETLGKVEVLATPRLLVLNKQLAELQLGDRLGYKTFSQSLVSTVENVQFLNVGTQLRVRPFIASDGMVRMEIHPERSTGIVVDNVPQTNTSEVTSNVMVPDGATIVIGGLIEQQRERRQNGVPYLSDLPGVGFLFRERQQKMVKKELIVLLTPRIWNPSQPHSASEIPPQAMPYLPISGRDASPVAILVRRSCESALVGQEVHYEVEVVNRTSQPLSGAVLNATVSAGLRPLGGEGPEGATIRGEEILLPLQAGLRPAERMIFRLRTVAHAEGVQRLRLQFNSHSLPEMIRLDDSIRVLSSSRAGSQPGTATLLLSTP